MPKLSMGGKVKHYPYTPDGKLAYERDKAKARMSPSSVGWDADEAGLPYVYKYPEAAKRKRPTPKDDQSKRRKLTRVKPKPKKQSPKKKSMGGPSWGEFPKPSK
jgi:hypothetical protein